MDKPVKKLTLKPEIEKILSMQNDGSKDYIQKTLSLSNGKDDIFARKQYKSYKKVHIYTYYIETPDFKPDKRTGEYKQIPKVEREFKGYGFKSGAPFDTFKEATDFIDHLLSTATTREEIQDTINVLNEPYK